MDQRFYSFALLVLEQVEHLNNERRTEELANILQDAAESYITRQEDDYGDH